MEWSREGCDDEAGYFKMASFKFMHGWFWWRSDSEYSDGRIAAVRSLFRACRRGKDFCAHDGWWWGRW